VENSSNIDTHADKCTQYKSRKSRKSRKVVEVIWATQFLVLVSLPLFIVRLCICKFRPNVQIELKYDGDGTNPILISHCRGFFRLVLKMGDIG